MGDIIGGVLGGVGSIAGALIQANAAAQARKDALTGYNYLTSGPGGVAAKSYIDSGTNALARVNGAQGAQSQLLGLSAPTPGTTGAFDNYLKSTGYQFQLKQGQDAITTSNAAKGLLNSGGTLKALDEYGQGLAANSFNNYLGQVGALNNQAQNTATAGQNQLTAIGNAGTGAGSNAAQYTAAGGNAIANGVSGALGGFGGALTNYLSRGNGASNPAGVY